MHRHGPIGMLRLNVPIQTSMPTTSSIRPHSPHCGLDRVVHTLRGVFDRPRFAHQLRLHHFEVAGRRRHLDLLLSHTPTGSKNLSCPDLPKPFIPQLHITDGLMQ